MNYTPDLIEEQISSIDLAWDTINKKLPNFNKLYDIWLNWYQEITADSPMQAIIGDALVISYVRMALRNGSLSINPRHYHNETHIDDLLYRMMAVSTLPTSQNIPDYGWALLSVFMSSHDLRQSEENDDETLIGNNEQSSYQEISRLLRQLDKVNVIRHEHKELLKLMIHGSTFGKGEDTKGNIYKGNLVRYLLKDVAYFETMDKELAYIACDIDTANVAAHLKNYAQSSINVYNEIQNISSSPISAFSFFGEQQEQYFFDLQRFNSKLGFEAFSYQKQRNAPKVKFISLAIKKLDRKMSNEAIVQYYLSQINAIK